MNELAKIDDPALMQWASSISSPPSLKVKNELPRDFSSSEAEESCISDICKATTTKPGRKRSCNNTLDLGLVDYLSAAAAKVVGGNAQTGSSVAGSETKNNYLSHWQESEKRRQLAECKTEEDRRKIEEYWYNVDIVQDSIMNGLGYTPAMLNDPSNDVLMQQVANIALDILATSSSESIKAYDWASKGAIVIGGGVLGASIAGTALYEAVAAGEVVLVATGGRIYAQVVRYTDRVKDWLGISQVANKPPELLNELANSGVKYTPANVVAITRTANGQLVWLETGSRTAGLQHILTDHAIDFANKGIASSQIPDFHYDGIKSRTNYCLSGTRNWKANI